MKPFDRYQDIEQNGYVTFTGLKNYNENLKTLLAVGGWNEGSSKFSAIAASPERRKEFIENTIMFLRKNDFDGLDLVWTYPAFREGGTPEDKKNYVQLVQELREGFDRESSSGDERLLLTMAVPTGLDFIDKGFDVSKLNKHLDWMNVLSYDYDFNYDASTHVNHHSPLYPLKKLANNEYKSNLNINATIKYYLNAGASPEKLVVGIPSYGRSYTLKDAAVHEINSPVSGVGEKAKTITDSGFLPYYEICDNIKNHGWKVEETETGIAGPYAHKEKQWVGYDDEMSVKKKAEYVVKMGLGGIMFWTLDTDDFGGYCHGKTFPLIKAGKEFLEKAKSNIKKLPQGNIKLNNLHSFIYFFYFFVYFLDLKCEGIGFFPHPSDCKTYFWCSKPSEPGLLLTCSPGLYFNKAVNSCDFPENVPCSEKN